MLERMAAKKAANKAAKQAATMVARLSIDTAFSSSSSAAAPAATDGAGIPSAAAAVAPATSSDVTEQAEKMVAHLSIDTAFSSSSSAAAPAAADGAGIPSAAAAVAPATASDVPGRDAMPATVEYVLVSSSSPPRPKLHVFFQAFPKMGLVSHEASFRAATVLSSPPQEQDVDLTIKSPQTSPAALQQPPKRQPISNRCKLLRPPPSPIRPVAATVGVQANLNPYTNTVETQTEPEQSEALDLHNTVETQTEPVTSEALHLHDVISAVQDCIQTELQRSLGFLVHLH